MIADGHGSAAVPVASADTELAALVRGALFWLPLCMLVAGLVTRFAPGPGPILIAAFLGLAIPFALREGRRDGLLAVGALFTFGLFFYEIINPLEYLIDPELPGHLVDEYPTLSAAKLTYPLLGTLTALGAFLVGYHRTAFGAPIPLRTPVDTPRLLRAAAAMFIVGAFLYILMGRWTTGTWFGYFTLTYRERNIAQYGHGALGFGIYLVYTASATIFTALLWREPSRRAKLVVVGIVLLVLTQSLLVGQKLHFYHVAFGVLVAYTLSQSARRLSVRQRRKRAVLLGATAFVALITIGVARHQQGYGAKAMYDEVTHSLEYQFLNPANIDSYGPYITLVESMSQNAPKQYGRSYLDTFALLVPRFLAPHRPLDISEAFARDYLGSRYFENQTFAFSTVAEGYVNFGFPGIALQYLVIGLCFGRLRRYVFGSPAALERVAVYAVFAPWVVFVVRNPVFSMVKGALLLNVAPALLLLWLARPHRPEPIEQPAPGMV